MILFVDLVQLPVEMIQKRLTDSLRSTSERIRSKIECGADGEYEDANLISQLLLLLFSVFFKGSNNYVRW
mgnify:FL=1